MHASRPRSDLGPGATACKALQPRSRGHSPARPRGPSVAGRADEAVSEVVGQILMFGILSMVLIMSLLSFNIAKETAQDRVLATTSESVAQRVATLVIDTALFAEQFQDQSVRMESRLELPLALEGHRYDIDLGTSSVTVTVPAVGRSASAPLFAAGSAGTVHICDQDPVEGSSMRIHVKTSPPADCPGAPAPDTDTDASGQPVGPPFYVYLEPDP